MRKESKVASSPTDRWPVISDLHPRGVVLQAAQSIRGLKSTISHFVHVASNGVANPSNGDLACAFSSYIFSLFLVYESLSSFRGVPIYSSSLHRLPNREFQVLVPVGDSFRRQTSHFVGRCRPESIRAWSCLQSANRSGVPLFVLPIHANRAGELRTFLFVANP